MKQAAPNAPNEKLEAILSAAFALRSKESSNLGLPEFPVENLVSAARLLAGKLLILRLFMLIP